MSSVNIQTASVVRQNAWRKSGAEKKTIFANSFFKEVKPILMMLMITGRFPYVISKDGIRPFSITSIVTVYSFLFYIVLCYFSFNAFLLFINEMLDDSQSYNQMLQVVILLAYILQHFIVPLTYWVQAPKLVRFIDMWSKYESEFPEDFLKPQYTRYSLFVTVASVPVSIIHVFVAAYELLGHRAYSALVFLPTAFSSYVLIYIWVVSLMEIRLQMKRLSSVMRMEGLRKDLDQRRRWWLSISRLTSWTGHALGLSCVGFSASAFVSLLIALYGFFTSLLGQWREWRLFWSVLLTFLYFFVMFDIADKATNEVGTKFTKMITRIKSNTLDEKDFREIPLFMLTLSTCKPIIRFDGFLVIDRHLFGSLIANIMTFLLVLIQFRN